AEISVDGIAPDIEAVIGFGVTGLGDLVHDESRTGNIGALASQAIKVADFFHIVPQPVGIEAYPAGFTILAAEEAAQCTVRRAGAEGADRDPPNVVKLAGLLPPEPCAR